MQSMKIINFCINVKCLLANRNPFKYIMNNTLFVHGTTHDAVWTTVEYDTGVICKLIK